MPTIRYFRMQSTVGVIFRSQGQKKQYALNDIFRPYPAAAATPSKILKATRSPAVAERPRDAL